MSSTDVDRAGPFRPTVPWLGRAMTYLFLGLVAITVVYPVFWIVESSLKTNTELFNSPWAFPSRPLWKNYLDAWTTAHTGLYFLNSVIVSSVSLALIVVLSAMCAFAITRLRWKLSGLVLGIFLLGTMVPVHAALIPLFIFFTKLRLTDTYVSLVSIYVGFAFPIAMFILTGFFTTIPHEIEQSAVLDGCSIGRLFWQIIMPMTRPALMTVAMFNFVSIWNELLVALVFLSNQRRFTLPVGLSNFKAEFSTDFATMCAAIVMAILPSVVVYTLFSNRIVAGMTSGAIKG